MVTTLQALQSKASEYASDCVDANAESKQFSFAKDNQFNFITGEGYGMSGTLNDWAFGQVCSRFNVPAGWLGNPEACPEALKVDILNDLASQYRDNANYLVRMKGTVIRALLSNQYSIFDNKEFIDLVGEAVSTMGIEPQVARYALDDDMRAYVVFPSVTFAPDPQTNRGGGGVHVADRGNKDDGGLHPAVYICNSERGGRSAKVVGAVFRSICSNGMIFGWKEENAFVVRHRFHSNAMMAALVADGLTEALKMSEEATRKFIASQDKKVQAPNLKSLVDGWADKYGLTIEAKDNWLASITSEAIVNGRGDDVRLFDMVNAATYVAQTRTGTETEHMERMAGDLLRSV